MRSNLFCGSFKQYPEKAYYIFGPEDGSIKQAVVNEAGAVVYIPAKGSLNLTQTVNVVLYGRMAKAGFARVGDDLIREARDGNNKLELR